METQMLAEDEIKQAAQLLRAGELVAFPTETVYGLGADATNGPAVRRVYQAKGRPSDNPLIVHISQVAEVMPFVENVPSSFDMLTQAFWPGPLTLILPCRQGSLPDAVTGGLSTVAWRMPDNNITLQLIRQAGVPLVGPSANTSGKPSPTTAAHVWNDLAGKIGGILDGGATRIGVESTVLDLSTAIPTILRPGALTVADLEAVIGQVVVDNPILAKGEVPKAPGMKYQHYAPNVPVKMLQVHASDWQQALTQAKQADKRVGFLVNRTVLEQLPVEIASYCLTETGDVSQAMHHLFAGLRSLDELHPPLDEIFVESFPEVDKGVAYMNRLKKAANQQFFSPPKNT